MQASSSAVSDRLNADPVNLQSCELTRSHCLKWRTLALMVITGAFLGRGTLNPLKLTIGMKKDEIECMLLFHRLQPKISRSLWPHSHVAVTLIYVWLIARVYQQTRQQSGCPPDRNRPPLRLAPRWQGSECCLILPEKPKPVSRLSPQVMLAGVCKGAPDSFLKLSFKY